MYFILILFFASLFSIIVMVGRKLALIRNGQLVVPSEEETTLRTPFLEEWKHLTIKGIKKHSYIGLVTVIRFYFRSSNLLKNKYQEIRMTLKSKKVIVANEKKEISGFLKTVSEYKQKIREIKHKIKKEEENS